MAIPEGKFIIVSCCADCGAELNRSNPLSGMDYTFAVMAEPLSTRRCPNGCRSTFSDCNINTRHRWEREDGTPCEIQPGN